MTARGPRRSVKPTTQNETRMRKPNRTPNPAKRRKRRGGEVQTIKEKTGCYRVKAVVAVEHSLMAQRFDGSDHASVVSSC